MSASQSSSTPESTGSTSSWDADWLVAAEEAGFVCDEDLEDEANIPPHYDWFSDSETSYFYACPHASDPSKIYVYGVTSPETDEICVFPISYVSSSEIYRYLEPDALLVLHECIEMDDDGVTVSFAETDAVAESVFNGIFIVEATYEDEMELCLYDGTTSTCPNSDSPASMYPAYYSFGTFR